MNIKMKGLQEYLNDDADLTKEITYEDFNNGVMSPKNSDYVLENAYVEYQNTVKEIQMNR